MFTSHLDPRVGSQKADNSNAPEQSAESMSKRLVDLRWPLESGGGIFNDGMMNMPDSRRSA